jgi:N-glycosylase/DNA lyase
MTTHTPISRSLDRTLLAEEVAGFETAQVRRSSPEPVGRHVDLTIDAWDLRFYWGFAHELGTAAYWVEQTRLRDTPESYALGATLAEEVAACLLGGHGIPADIGLAAYRAVRDAGLLDAPADTDVYEAVLATPLRVPGRDRAVRYRFARQRARRLAESLAVLDRAVPPADPLALRSWLMNLPGVGPKTASWIVRNRSASDEIAIIDVHVHRAGIAAGFFSASWLLPRDYAIFEAAFCRVAALGGVSAAALDACVWDQMQRLGRAQRLLLGL